MNINRNIRLFSNKMNFYMKKLTKKLLKIKNNKY